MKEKYRVKWLCPQEREYGSALAYLLTCDSDGLPPTYVNNPWAAVSIVERRNDGEIVELITEMDRKEVTE